ncbi:MAG: hypothetical protein K6A94_01020 [Bacteroidales bacterium]|nr:hypothetical protein [Bacteroidales bacterium]
MKPKKETVKKYTMSELRELDDSQLDEIIASRKYLKEGDRPCADRGAKMLLIIDKQKGWR